MVRIRACGGENYTANIERLWTAKEAEKRALPSWLLAKKKKKEERIGVQKGRSH